MFLVDKDLPSRRLSETTFNPDGVSREGLLSRGSLLSREDLLSREGLLLGEGILSRQGFKTVSCSERTSYPEGPPLKGVLSKEGPLSP